MKTLIPLLALACVMRIGDAAITGWTNPNIPGAASGSGSLSVAEDHALSTTIDTYVANTDATLGEYTLLTTGTPFSLTTAGVLTITSNLDYETTASYSLEIQVADDGPSSGTATIAVTVTDVNEAPAFGKSSYGVTIADNAGAGTTLTTTTATDQDSGDTVTYSIAAGDANSDFTIGASTGVITVNTGKALDASTTAGYALQVEAADDDGTPLTGTTTVFVLVGSFSGASSLVAGIAMTLLVAFLTMLH